MKKRMVHNTDSLILLPECFPKWHPPCSVSLLISKDSRTHLWKEPRPSNCTGVTALSSAFPLLLCHSARAGKRQIGRVYFKNVLALAPRSLPARSTGTVRGRVCRNSNAGKWMGNKSRQQNGSGFAIRERAIHLGLFGAGWPECGRPYRAGNVATVDGARSAFRSRSGAARLSTFNSPTLRSPTPPMVQVKVIQTTASWHTYNRWPPPPPRALQLECPLSKHFYVNAIFVKWMCHRSVCPTWRVVWNGRRRSTADWTSLFAKCQAAGSTRWPLFAVI